MNQMYKNNNKNSCHFDKRERHETEPKTINEKLRAGEVVRLRETVWERDIIKQNLSAYIEHNAFVMEP